MRKVIGIGETILDIIFRGDQPSAAVPGGSVFNGIVSLGRMGINVGFISETGNDRVGNIILQFMRENHIPTDHVNVFPDGKSPVSLAFLNEQSDAEYIFYKDYPKQRLDVLFPKLEEDDIVMVGSYYALNPVLREKILELLDQAREKKAIIYYDPNFRSSHKNEAMKLAPTIIENLEYADIVRGSLEDFLYMYNMQDIDKIYKDKIKFYCPRFICTAGAEKVALRTNLVNKDYPIEPLQAVSTIGAGDNFNAGVDPTDYQASMFTDVKEDAYYAPYVNWAAKTGVVSGTTDTTFAPDTNINREQMAVIMKNYATKLGYTIPKTLEVVNFADSAGISSWAKEAVKSMRQAGILAGKTNNCFDPAGTATRAEVATVLRRFVEIVIDPQTANGWVQNDSGEWSYYKNGALVKGWLSNDQKWYWLDKNTGKMFSGGWKQIDGKQYYFYADGSMAVNTTVDGKTIGADGADFAFARGTLILNCSEFPKI